MFALSVTALAASGCSYNNFVGQEEGIKAQWAEVENQLQRRNDLIPNLVESERVTVQQEQAVFGRIADSRGNLFVSETYGARIQKLVYKGLRPVTKKDQGAARPDSTN